MLAQVQPPVRRFSRSERDIQSKAMLLVGTHVKTGRACRDHLQKEVFSLALEKMLPYNRKRWRH